MLRYALFLLLLGFQTEPKPLPEAGPFIAQFRKSLRTDGALLSNYTYTEKRTSIELDSNRRPKKTEVNVFQVFPGSCERLGYRRQVVKNGVPVSEKELAKQDQEHQKRVANGERGGGPRGGAGGRRGRRGRGDVSGCNNTAEDQKIIDDLFGVYDIQMVGREEVAGHSTVVVTFKPRANYEPKTSQGEYMQHVAGRAWVSEDDYQLARVDAQVIDDISFGFGVLAKLKKGAHIFAERHKFNEEVWLPSRTEVSLEARVVFKGFNVQQIVEFTEHKKFSVDTKLSFPDSPGQPEP